MTAPILHEDQLDKFLTQLEQRRQWSPRVISRLETLIRTGEDAELFRINPLKYAVDRGMDETESLDLFLHGSHIGLFQMEWNLVCAACGEIVDSMHGMSGLHSEFVCNFCSLANHAAMDDLIMVSFSLSPTVRDLKFFHPTDLDPEDYHYFFRMANLGKPLADGTPHLDYLKKITRLMSFLAPGEKTSVEFKAEHGIVFATDYRGGSHYLLFITEEHADAPQELTVRINGESVEIEGLPTTPGPVSLGTFNFHPMLSGQLKSGTIKINIENAGGNRAAQWIAHAQFSTHTPIQLIPFLTGKRLLNTQTFRNLFRTEVIGSDEGIEVRDLTFLFTDLKGSTEMYEQIGDPKAYYLVRQHFETLTRAVTEHDGATVKTIGDAIMATFLEPTQALTAAKRMIRDINDFNQTHNTNLVLKIGMHRGQSIAVSLNDRMDFFGQSVNIAARVQGLADAGEIYISDSVYKSEGVEGTLSDLKVTPQQAALKGVSEKVQVYQLSLAG